MLTVQSILERKGQTVQTVAAADTVLRAAELMNQHRIGALVVSSGDKVVGIFTERDILNRVVAARRDPATTKVEQVMTTPMICGRRNTTLAECRSIMTGKRIRHLPIVEEGRLYGLISSGDLLATEVQDQQVTIEYLHEYVHGRF